MLINLYPVIVVVCTAASVIFPRVFSGTISRFVCEFAIFTFR